MRDASVIINAHFTKFVAKRNSKLSVNYAMKISTVIYCILIVLLLYLAQLITQYTRKYNTQCHNVFVVT